LEPDILLFQALGISTELRIYVGVIP